MGTSLGETISHQVRRARRDSTDGLRRGRNVANGQRATPGGDRTKFLHGEEVLLAAEASLLEIVEGDDGAGAAEAGKLRCARTEPGVVAQAKNSREHIDDAAVGFEIEVHERGAGGRDLHEGQFLVRHAMHWIQFGQSGAAFADGFRREHGAHIEIVRNQAGAVGDSGVTADDKEIELRVSETLQKQMQVVQSACGRPHSIRGKARAPRRGAEGVPRATARGCTRSN